jgi:hypothetical protein
MSSFVRNSHVTQWMYVEYIHWSDIVKSKEVKSKLNDRSCLEKCLE